MQAITYSCNYFFYYYGDELGIDKMAYYAKLYGLGEHTGIELPEVTGQMSTQSFKEQYTGISWYNGDTLQSAIGQSFTEFTPLQMAEYCAAIANGGSVVEPSLLLDTPSGSSTSLLSATTANKLRDMMNYNVSAHYGTNRFPGLNLCAKTGTAEVGDGTSHAWFTGFLLDDAHPYAFVVLVENAGGGLTNAGAVANTVLQAAVNK